MNVPPADQYQAAAAAATMPTAPGPRKAWLADLAAAVHAEAACKTRPLDEFVVPLAGRADVRRHVRTAAAICDQCPVSTPCLTLGICRSSGSEFGIYGGHSPEAVRVIARTARTGQRALVSRWLTG